jgi:16S rRNA (guanine966-N2)-methyltransferase
MRHSRQALKNNRQKAHKHSKKANQGIGEVRIIGGDYRGRKLPVLQSDGLRPTSDRVRETLFNWLQFELPGAHCLDLFAGSGALGLEALSRGGNYVEFCEKDAQVAQQLRINLQTLHAKNARLNQVDTLDWLRKSPEQAFDIVFIDPPFNNDMTQTVLQSLSQKGWLNNGALIYLEQEKQLEWPELPPSWSYQKQKQTSQVRYGLIATL